MSTLDYLLLALIVIAAFLALRFVRKGKKNGGCGGDCAHCGSTCRTTKRSLHRWKNPRSLKLRGFCLL